MSTIRKINTALAKAGVGERLTRNPKGYYYLYSETFEGPMIECSIYTFVLDNTVEDYNLAVHYINEAFEAKGLKAPLTEKTA